MGREIPVQTRIEVARLYLAGEPYEKIAARLGIATGSVAAIVAELREGRLPQFERITDMVEALRELAVGLRKGGVAPSEAPLLFILTRRFLSLGVEPAQLEGWLRMCEAVPEGELPRSRIMAAAVKLTELEEGGISYDEALDRLRGAAAQVKELEQRLTELRAEESRLEEHRAALAAACQEQEAEGRRLEAEREETSAKVGELLGQRRKLDQDVKQRQMAASQLEGREKELAAKVSTLEEKAAGLNQDIVGLQQELRTLEEIGFPRASLEELRARLAEMAERHGKEGLTQHFLGYLGTYDSLLVAEAARDSLGREVARLTQQRESIARLGERVGLTPEELTEALAVLKDLSRKGVRPSAIVSYQRSLGGLDPASFQELVRECGGVEAAVASRRSQLEGLTQQMAAKQQALELLKSEEGRLRESITTLRDSGLREVQALAISARAEVQKLCHGLQADILKWGEVRGEMGRWEEGLRLARYFTNLPLTEAALSSLVEEINEVVVAQYLMIVRAFCQKRLNPKLRPPRAVIERYHWISEHTEVELADVIGWALLALAEGVSRAK